MRGFPQPPPNKLGAVSEKPCFLPDIRQPFPKGGQKTLRYARFPPRDAGFLRSPAKKAHWAFFPWLPLRRLVGAPPRASRARSRGGLAFPPLSPVARVCFVPSSSRKGSARAYRPLALRSVSLPLRSFGFGLSWSPSGFRLALNAVAGPLALYPSFPRPKRFPPALALSPLPLPAGGSRSFVALLLVARRGRFPPPAVKKGAKFRLYGVFAFSWLLYLPPPARLSRRERREARAKGFECLN